MSRLPGCSTHSSAPAVSCTQSPPAPLTIAPPPYKTANHPPIKATSSRCICHNGILVSFLFFFFFFYRIQSLNRRVCLFIAPIALSDLQVGNLCLMVQLMLVSQHMRARPLQGYDLLSSQKLSLCLRLRARPPTGPAPLSPMLHHPQTAELRPPTSYR